MKVSREELKKSNWIIINETSNNGIEEGRLLKAINKVTGKCVGETFIPLSYLHKCNTRDIPLVYQEERFFLQQRIDFFLEFKKPISY